MRLIPVLDEALLKENGIFFKPSTLRTWHHKRRFPFIKKIAGRLFIDIREWEKFIDSDDSGETDVQPSA